MASGLKIDINVAGFHAQLHALADDMNRATRPAAQAGAQVIYDRAKSIAATLRSDREHYFYGTATKALPRGEKRAGAYGPFKPGSLYESIYQVFSQDNSFLDVSVYHISWNATKAPYGAMVELGTSRAPAHSFIGRAVKESRGEVKDAMKARFIAEVTGA